MGAAARARRVDPRRPRGIVRRTSPIHAERSRRQPLVLARNPGGHDETRIPLPPATADSRQPAFAVRVAARRFPIRGPSPDPPPRLHDARRGHARDRHRRHHGHLQRDQSDSPRRASVPARRAHRHDVGRHGAGDEGQRRLAHVRRRLESEPFVRRDRGLQGLERDAHRARRARTVRRTAREPRLLQSPRRAPRARPRLSAGRRCPERPARRDPERSALAPAVRRRFADRRQAGVVQRIPVHDHRRHARRFREHPPARRQTMGADAVQRVAAVGVPYMPSPQSCSAHQDRHERARRARRRERDLDGLGARSSQGICESGNAAHPDARAGHGRRAARFSSR